MRYNIYGLLLDVNVQNTVIRDFFESKFSSFKVERKECVKIIKNLSISERKDVRDFQSLDELEEKGPHTFEGISNSIFLHGQCYYFKHVYDNFIFWNTDSCFFYLGNTETYILTVVCGYLLKQVVGALSDLGIICLHGAGVTVNHDLDNGLLIFGQSGSGKSSISIKLVEEYKERLICDDVLMLKRVSGHVSGLSNQQFVNIEKGNLAENYTQMRDYIVESVDPFNTKVKIDLNKYSKNAFAPFIVPKTILFSSLERGSQCTIRSLKPIVALQRIVKEVQFYINSQYVPVIYDLIEQCNIYEIIPSVNLEITVQEIYRVLS